MLLWILFIAVVLLFLALDLGVFHKNAEIISNKDAAKWTLIWVTVSLCFSGGIYVLYESGLVSNPENYSSTEAVLIYHWLFGRIIVECRQHFCHSGYL
jgi:tellurite resistance protein TerC